MICDRKVWTLFGPSTTDSCQKTTRKYGVCVVVINNDPTVYCNIDWFHLVCSFYASIFYPFCEQHGLETTLFSRENWGVELSNKRAPISAKGNVWLPVRWRNGWLESQGVAMLKSEQCGNLWVYVGIVLSWVVYVSICCIYPSVLFAVHVHGVLYSLTRSSVGLKRSLTTACKMNWTSAK